MSLCKRCLLSEINEKDLAKNINDYIIHLSDDIKASTRIYAERISMCKSCDYLINGICKHCGCFVEMRAAIKTNYCPDTPQKW